MLDAGVLDEIAISGDVLVATELDGSSGLSLLEPDTDALDEITINDEVLTSTGIIELDGSTGA